MPRLSIIVPVLGCASRLETTLVSVLEHRPDDCEVLVVLDTPYEDPYELAGEVQFIESPGAVGFAASVNAGIQASCADFVHVLAAGVEVCEGWADFALPHFRDPRVSAVSPIVHDVLDRAEFSPPVLNTPRAMGEKSAPPPIIRFSPTKYLGRSRRQDSTDAPRWNSSDTSRRRSVI